jgi:hypothetical protein
MNAGAKNLIPWKPGESGNPKGPPRARPMVTPALRKFAKLPLMELVRLLADPEEQQKLTVADGIALVMLEKGLFEKAWGDKTREEIVKRLDGDRSEVEDDTDADSEKTPIIYQGVPPMLFGKKA